jgi:DNA-directed RNA polymerase beta' subunit
MGAEALYGFVKQRLDLDELSYELRHKATPKLLSNVSRKHLSALQVVEAFRDANTRIENRPEWMIVKVQFRLFHRNYVHWCHWMVAVLLHLTSMTFIAG